MGQILENPTISLQANIGSPLIYYFADGAALFGCIGNPEGVIAANKRSIAVSDDGNIYIKTTDNVNTGWNVNGGGGGSGTVTSIGVTANSIFDLTGSSANPITGAGTFDFQFASQTANKVFASPSAAPGVPTFRTLTSTDLALAAAPPANGVQYNDGTNAFTASNGFRFDAASNTVQAGESTVLKGTFQMFAALSAGSVKHTVNNPAGNYVFIWGDSLPANNDLLRASVSGSNVTISSIAASALGFPTINATDGVLPYRSSASAFSDSPIVRNGANDVSIGNVGSFAGLQIQGNAAGSLLVLQVLSSGSNEDISIRSKGSSSPRLFSTSGGYWVFSRNDSGSFTYAAFGRSTDSGFKVDAQSTYNFTGTNGNATAASDTGLARRQAGYTRFTNGSTGIGGLLVGGSTATPIGQTHLINGAVGVQPLFLEAIASTSVATIKAETSAIQSFAFMPSGKLIGGCNVPTSNQQFSAIGNAKSDVSTIGNVGTGVDNLLSFSIGANVLANNGDYAEFDAFGEFENNANNKELKIVYGATTIFATGAVAFGTAGLANWRVNAKIVRTGVNSQKCIVTFWCNDSSVNFLQQITTSAEDMTAAKTIQFTGEATATDDIIQLHLESKLCVALTS